VESVARWRSRAIGGVGILVRCGPFCTRSLAHEITARWRTDIPKLLFDLALSSSTSLDRAICPCGAEHSSIERNRVIVIVEKESTELLSARQRSGAF